MPETIEDGELDVPYNVTGDLRLSGERVVIGYNDDGDLVLDHGAEVIYMEPAEAEMLISTLRAAVIGAQNRDR